MPANTRTNGLVVTSLALKPGRPRKSRPSWWRKRIRFRTSPPKTTCPRLPSWCDARDGAWGLRCFIPTVEVALCGPETPAAAYVLMGDTTRIDFHSTSGKLTVGRADGRLALDFPGLPIQGVIDASEVSASLSAALVAICGMHEIHQARYLLAEYESAAQVAEIEVVCIAGTNVICSAPSNTDDVDFALL